MSYDVIMGWAYDHSRAVPIPCAFLLGCIFLGLAVNLLCHTLYRSDYLVYVGVFIGFIPFALGMALIIFCFLPYPPPIFGFWVGHYAP